MENKKLTGIRDKKGKDLFDGAKVRHHNQEGESKVYVVKWSANDGQWIGDCPDEIYDLSQELLTESFLMEEKKLYFQLSDGADYSGVTMDLSGVTTWIEGDADNYKEDEEDMPEYTITPVWMTEEEFDNLPEAE